MKKSQARKLGLARETLVALQADALEAVGGGGATLAPTVPSFQSRSCSWCVVTMYCAR